MRTIGITLGICAITLLAFCYLFRESLSAKIIESSCTDFEFYHIKLKICNDNAKQLIQLEKDSIALIVTQLEEDNHELAAINTELKTALDKCTTSPNINKILRLSEENMNNHRLLKPKLEMYKAANVSPSNPPTL